MLLLKLYRIIRTMLLNKRSKLVEKARKDLDTINAQSSALESQHSTVVEEAKRKHKEHLETLHKDKEKCKSVLVDKSLTVIETIHELENL